MWDEMADTAAPPDESDTDVAEPTCDEAMPLSLFLSSDDSNSMTSAIIARHAGTSLGRVPVRTWEFLNDATFAYPRPEPGSLGVSAAMHRFDADGADRFALQIAVTSEARNVAERQPINLVFAVDVSGSMGGHPLDMAKAVGIEAAGALKEGDRVSIVTWSTDRAVVLNDHEVIGPNDADVIRGLPGHAHEWGHQPLGGTSELPTAWLRSTRQSDRITRVVLISDGGANAGVTDVETIANHASGENAEGIYLVGVGVGTATSYNDDLMGLGERRGQGRVLVRRRTGGCAAVFPRPVREHLRCGRPGCGTQPRSTGGI